MTVKVFVLDKDHKPLMPTTPARARRILKKGRARVHKLHPFTIRLVDRTLADSKVQSVLVKIDPGSKETGIAVVREDENSPFKVLSPCGVCQERLRYWGENVLVGVTTDDDSLCFVPLKELQPHHLSHAYPKEELEHYQE